MMNKKGASITNIIFTLLIGVFAMVAMFNFVVMNSNSAQLTVPTQYNDSFNELTAQQDELEQLSQNLTQGVNSLDEVDENFATGFAGFARGALSLFKAPVVLLSTASESLNILLNLPFISLLLHPIVISTLTIGVALIVILALVRFIAQRGNNA